MSHLATCFSDSKACQKNWNLMDKDRRSHYLHALAKYFAKDIKPGFEYQLRCAEQKAYQSELLTGPTGETNELYLSGRGVCLFIVAPDTPVSEKAVGALFAVVLAAGNSIVLCSDNDELNGSIQSAIKAANLPANLIQFCPSDSYKKLLSMDIRAAVLVGNKQAEQEVIQQLANRTGAIVALVSETDPENLTHSQDPNLVLRFITERTRTINITAVGGNASLLELGNDSH